MLGLMSHSERQRSRRADVAKYHDGPGHVATAVAERRGRVLDRYFNAVAPDQYTVRREGYGLVFLDRRRRRGSARHRESCHR